MPTSDPSGIAPVIREVMAMRPASILDVGIGMGKWGLLFREYLEGWGYHRYSKAQWKTRLEGAEIYEQYIQPWHREIYNAIHIGDIRTLAPTLTPVDLAYLGDVIEHMPKTDGLKLLKALRARAIIISTPAFKTRVNRKKPNPHQNHLSFWTAQDFAPFRHKVMHNARLLIVKVEK